MVCGVHTCADCGNSDVRVLVADSAVVHECGLCGARFGDRAAIAALEDRQAAAERGLSPLVWPLVRALEALPGLHVRSAVAGGLTPPTLPFVELGAGDQRVLLQLENLAKSLQLGAGALRCHWIVEVEYHRHLVFVLKPRHAGGPIAPEFVRDAQQDLGPLRRQLERDCRLGWWRQADEASNR
jgi:hypothetical protein